MKIFGNLKKAFRKLFFPFLPFFPFFLSSFYLHPHAEFRPESYQRFEADLLGGLEAEFPFSG